MQVYSYTALTTESCILAFSEQDLLVHMTKTHMLLKLFEEIQLKRVVAPATWWDLSIIGSYESQKPTWTQNNT